jgi:hypothetical protein
MLRVSSIFAYFASHFQHNTQNKLHYILQVEQTFSIKRKVSKILQIKITDDCDSTGNQEIGR